MLIVIEYKELCCLISSSRVTFSRDLIKSILVLSRVAGWAVGVFNIFFGGVRQGKFFSFTVNHLFDSEIFFQQLAVAEPDSDFHFFSAIGSC